MKKIITAMGDQNLNQKLKQEDFEILTEDISYKEGIIEFLEKGEADFLILNELLSGEIELKELVEKIKSSHPDIQIVVFLEKKNQELENYLYAKGIYSIFYDNQIEISKIIQLIKEEKQTENQQLKKEIEKLKQLVIEKENQIEKPKSFFQSKEDKKQNEIVCISGTSGVGKSIITINLAKSFMERYHKILIIDFDILNNSLHTILGIKKYPEKIVNKIKNNNLLEPLQIEELVMKVNAKIDLIAGINLLFDAQYQISKVKIKTILSELKEKYDAIVIDTSSECFLDYTKEIMKNSPINIFITEANLLEIKKAKRLLNIYINQWEIPQSNFHIIFNKYNENSIDISILKNVFSGFQILGKLSNSSKYNLIIDKNNKNDLEKDLQQEYSQFYQKLFKNKNEENQGRSLWKKC